jgi:hypothetical protein
MSGEGKRKASASYFKKSKRLRRMESSGMCVSINETVYVLRDLHREMNPVAVQVWGSALCE